jgi:putative hydrolase of the HAD superfamily
MPFSTLFFDLDDTLYPPRSGLWGEIGGRINLYMHDRLGFPLEDLEAVREKYFMEFGTTLRGLQAHHQVDMNEYLAFVHDVPLDRYIAPDPGLRAALASIPIRKFIFTNADKNHADRVVKRLGLEGLFEGTIDVHTIAPYCKPMPEAFELALAAAGNPDPASCLLLDDQARITRAAARLGMRTVLVGQREAGPDADAALPRLADLPELLKTLPGA